MVTNFQYSPASHPPQKWMVDVILSSFSIPCTGVNPSTLQSTLLYLYGTLTLKMPSLSGFHMPCLNFECIFSILGTISPTILMSMYRLLLN